MKNSYEGVTTATATGSLGGGGVDPKHENPHVGLSSRRPPCFWAFFLGALVFTGDAGAGRTPDSGAAPGTAWRRRSSQQIGGSSITHRIHGTGIFTYIWFTFMVNVGKYTIHGSYASMYFLLKNGVFFEPVMFVFRGRDPSRITGNILNPKSWSFGWKMDDFPDFNSGCFSGSTATNFFTGVRVDTVLLHTRIE